MTGTSIEKFLHQLGRKNFGLNEGLSYGGDKPLYPTRKMGIQMRIKRTEEVSFSSVVSIIGLPTMPQGTNRELMRVLIPRDAVLNYFIPEGNKYMAKEFPGLDPDDFCLQGDYKQNADLVLALGNNGDLLLDLEHSGTICFEPQWLPDVRQVTARQFSVRTVEDEIHTVGIEKSEKFFGELRVFPNGATNPLFVMQLPNKGDIVFTNARQTTRFTTVESAFKHIVESAKLVGAYDKMPESVLTKRMEYLHETLTEYSVERNMEFDSEGIIMTAVEKLTTRARSITISTTEEESFM